MSKLDRYKEEIALHKQLLFVSMGFASAVSGWLAKSYQDTPIVLLCISLAAIFSLCIFSIAQYRHIKKVLENIENQ